MKRGKLVFLETLLIFFIFCGIIYIIFSVYFIFNGIGKSEVNVNENNMLEVENMLKSSVYYDYTNKIEDLEKIQFFLNFNDYRFTLYYKDGMEKEIYDDSLNNLKVYIEKSGNSIVVRYFIIDILVTIVILLLNKQRKNISNEIDIINNIKEV